MHIQKDRERERKREKERKNPKELDRVHQRNFENSKLMRKVLVVECF